MYDLKHLRLAELWIAFRVVLAAEAWASGFFV